MIFGMNWSSTNSLTQSIAVLIVSAVLSGCATESTLQQSNAKWHPRESYFQSLDMDSLEQAARDGDSEASFQLAIRLMNGDRIGRNPERAVAVVRERAHDGDPRAQYLYGAALTSGSGIEMNESEAVKWFKKSAEQGYVSGEYWHAYMLSRGRGYDQPDWNEALKWFKRAARKGNFDAQATLGTAYEECRGGLERDYEKAAEWYRKAARDGEHMMARYNLRRLIDIGAVEWQEGDGGAPPIELEKVDPSFFEPCS